MKTNDLRIQFGRRAWFAAAVTPEQVATTRQYIVDIVGEVTPLDEMVRLTDYNRDWLHGVYDENTQSMQGAFAVFPLGDDATQRFYQNTMRGGQITLQHLVADTAEAASIYVGSIVSGKNSFTRAATLALYQKIMSGLQANAGHIPLFSRPVSEDGLRLVTKMGYRPVLDKPHAIGDMIYFKI